MEILRAWINTGSDGFLVDYDCVLIDFIHNKKNGNDASFKVVAEVRAQLLILEVTVKLQL